MSWRAIKNLRRKVAAYDITFWEIIPLLIAVILPNVLEPAWIWRLSLLFIAGVSLIVICFHALLAPEQFYKTAYSKLTKGRRYIFWLLYLSTIAVIPLVLSISIIPAGRDLYHVITSPDENLEKIVVEIIKTEGGGSVAPYFIGQRIITKDEKYNLPLSARRWGTGTYEITYSPRTNIIYDLKPVQ